jgi:hypothetical protein
VVIVSPRPGVSRDNLLQTLRNVHNGLLNLRGGGSGSAQARVLSYLEWATETTRILDYLVSPADIRRLVLTFGYERLLGVAALTGTDIGTQRVLNGMVSLEIDQRVQAFESTIAAVRVQIERWPLTPAFTVPDTSFYIEHEQKLEEADFQSVLSLPGMPVHVLVPIAVVDELDGLKKSKDRDTRWRAGYTLAVLDRVLGSDPAAWGYLRAQNFAKLNGCETPSSEVTMEIVFDPPAHVRLPISDDEIIDRILAIAPLAERKSPCSHTTPARRPAAGPRACRSASWPSRTSSLSTRAGAPMALTHGRSWPLSIRRLPSNSDETRKPERCSYVCQGWLAWLFVAAISGLLTGSNRAEIAGGRTRQGRAAPGGGQALIRSRGQQVDGARGRPANRSKASTSAAAE